MKEDQFHGYFHYGAMTQVAYDLGIKPHPFYIKEFDNGAVADRKNFSTEVLGKILDADYLLSTYRGQYGVSKQKIFEALDETMPGWKNLTKAYQDNTFILTNRETSFATSFKTYDLILDEFAKIAK